MTLDEVPTVVVFRTWKPKYAKSLCQVIALFPEVDEGRGMCSSYEHVGQHGPANYADCIFMTRPATLEEYANLAAELRGIGYNLKIQKRK